MFSLVGPPGEIFPSGDSSLLDFGGPTPAGSSPSPVAALSQAHFILSNTSLGPLPWPPLSSSPLTFLLLFCSVLFSLNSCTLRDFTTSHDYQSSLHEGSHSLVEKVREVWRGQTIWNLVRRVRTFIPSIMVPLGEQRKSQYDLWLERHIFEGYD